MATERVERRLAAILAADVAGYSRLMGADEEGTLARLKAHRHELIDRKIKEHKGRIVKTTGDGMLVEFPSVVDAVRCAVEVQLGMVERNAAVPAEKRIEFRVGIHQGDIIVEDSDIFGDGVNLASRLEGLAEPGRICVSRVVRDEVRDKLDVAFDDLGEQQLKNITRRVRAFAVRLGHEATKVPIDKPPLPLPDKPSIAVLPFANMSGDAEQEYFADGMVEEIITALSRIRWLFVIARNSSFTYKGKAVDVKQVGRELGVRYLLEGSVRKGGNRVRITAQLIDALNGTHLWADHFDGSLEDVFELQDKVAVTVAGVIEPALQAAETARSASRPTADLTAYDLYLRAFPHSMSQERNRIAQALDMLGLAIARDPHYGPALALAAFCHHQIVNNGWFEDREASARTALDLGRRAVRAGDDDPGVLANAAFVLGFFGEDMNATLALMDHCLAINPSFAFGWFQSGMLRLFAGQPELAIRYFETSLRLNPRDSMAGRVVTGIAIGLFMQRRFEEAAAKLVVSLEALPSFTTTYRFLASSYADMGRLAEARQIVERLQTLTPVVVPMLTNFRNPEHRELFLSGLRLAVGKEP